MLTNLKPALSNLKLRFPPENACPSSTHAHRLYSNTTRALHRPAFRNNGNPTGVFLGSVLGETNARRRGWRLKCHAVHDMWHRDSDLCSSEMTPQGGIVALGKFDALHIGHRSLAIQASQMGQPWLLSFSGMAEVLGWDKRLPLVASCDRKRVISDWSNFCNGKIPQEYVLEFSKIRRLNATEFIRLLADDLQVEGVVAGVNYRFGYKAASDSSDLVKLCKEHNLKVHIVTPVLDTSNLSVEAPLTQLNSVNDSSKSLMEDLNNQVSSTKVRKSMSLGRMNYVAELLGRRHRIFVSLNDASDLSFHSSKLNDSTNRIFLEMEDEFGDIRYETEGISSSEFLENQLFDGFDDTFLQSTRLGIAHAMEDDLGHLSWRLQFGAHLFLNQYPSDGCYLCKVKCHRFISCADENTSMSMADELDLGPGCMRIRSGKVVVVWKNRTARLELDLKEMTHLSLEL